MGKMTSINGDILRWAREESNVDIAFVAKTLKKDITVIHFWERGEDYPTYAQLERLGDIYKKPIAIFFFPEPPQLPDLKASYRTLPDHVYESFSHILIRKMNEARALQLNLYELHDGLNPSTKLLTEQNVSNDIIVLAQQLRESLGISLEQQKSCRSAKEAFEMWRNCFLESGIYVFKEAFRDDSVSGFCLYDDVFPIIYVNNSMSFTRQIFTLFHEVFHLISQTSGVDKLKDDYFGNLSEEDLYIEMTCNSFAAEFLVPDSDFDRELEDVDKITEAFISNMARKYNISREVIMRKLLNRGLISQNLYETQRQLYIDEAIRARDSKKDGGNPYYTRISYLGRGYLNLVFNQYRRSEIDVFQLSDFTRTRVEHLGKLYSHWERLVES